MCEARCHSEAERVRRQTSDARCLSFNERVALMGDLTVVCRSLHSMYFRCFHPQATDQQVIDHWLRLSVEPELYVQVREKRAADGIDVLPLPMPRDIRIDTMIRRWLEFDRRQVFCEQYHESLPAVPAI